MASRELSQSITVLEVATPLDWVVAADEICSATAAAAPKMFRRVAEDLYEGLLNDVQDYLRENVAFNLSSELALAKARETQAREALQRVAEALGSFRMGWPCGPSVEKIADEAVAAIERLKSADPDLLSVAKMMLKTDDEWKALSMDERSRVEAVIARAEGK